MATCPGLPVRCECCLRPARLAGSGRRPEAMGLMWRGGRRLCGPGRGPLGRIWAAAPWARVLLESGASRKIARFHVYTGGAPSAVLGPPGARARRPHFPGASGAWSVGPAAAARDRHATWRCGGELTKTTRFATDDMPCHSVRPGCRGDVCEPPVSDGLLSGGSWRQESAQAGPSDEQKHATGGMSSARRRGPWVPGGCRPSL